MRKSATERMRRYWDERARLNALWYVDTTLNFDSPDIDRFFIDGERIVAHVLERVPAVVGTDRVALEIGCGLGRLCRALTGSFERVIGLDISPEMVERAKQLVPECEFHVNDGSGLTGIPDESVDFVLTFTVFQHIPDQEVIGRYVREIGRVLRPGGCAYLQWNASPGIRWSFHRWLSIARHRAGLDGSRRGTDAAEFQGSRISLRVMRGWLAGAGLQIVDLDVPAGLWAQAWVIRADPSMSTLVRP